MEYWDLTMKPQALATMRASAVQAVREGEKIRQVALRFGVARQTLYNWVAKHERGGAAALAARPRGRTRRKVLEPSQEAQVADAIMLESPTIVHRHYTRWTKKAIAAFVEQRFGVHFSPWQVDSHLRRWGFASHKEVRRAFMNTQGREDAWNRRTRSGPAEVSGACEAPYLMSNQRKEHCREMH